MTTVAADRRTEPARLRRLRPSAWRRVLLSREMAIIGLLAVVVLVATPSGAKFATTVTLGYLLSDITPLLFIALAMAPVMITGHRPVRRLDGRPVERRRRPVLPGGPADPCRDRAALVVGALGGVLTACW